MPRGRKKMKAVQAVIAPTFDEVFELYVGIITRVHGQEVADTYRTLREGEALMVLSTDGMTGYPDAGEQAQQFLSYRISND